MLLQNSPFRSLCLLPNPDESSDVDVFAHDIREKTFKVLGKQHDWQRLVGYCWEYGEKRQKAKVRQIMRDNLPYSELPLPQLVKAKFEAIAAEHEGDTCVWISNAKKALAGGDMGEGLRNIFMPFQGFSPRIWRDDNKKDAWKLSFKVCLRVLVSYLDC